MGNLVGCLPSLPRQDHMLGLPMQLLSEEVFLLLNKKIAKLVQFKALSHPAQEDERQEIKKINKASFLKQESLYKEERTRQVLNMADKIIEGKRKKMKEQFDEKIALQEEIDKIPNMSEDLMMIQIYTCDVILIYVSFVEIG